MTTLESTVVGQIYVACLLFGGGFLLVAFLTGGHHFHHGIGHGHLGSLGHQFNLRNVLAFVAAFGAIGVISTLSAITLILSLLLSVGAGLAVAVASGWFFTKMIEQQGTSQPDDSDLAGIRAKVVVAIPADGRCGEVRAVVKNQFITIRAKPHRPGESFARGDSV
ncbi:MAG: hypothetical protein KGJ86_15440, partial [Chloroflexota bacterium]|nr:hypothetical protein [Chloroflexota bacterium]